MADHTDELAGLPEDVREALSYFADAETALEGEGHNGTMYTTIRAELLRLARENAELRKINEHANRANMQAQHFRDCAEAELAALKRRIADDYERGRQDGINFGPSVREQIDISRDLDHE